MKFQIDGYSYETIDFEIKINDFFIQQDGGKGKPILRKYVDTKMPLNLKKFASKNGYFPLDSLTCVKSICHCVVDSNNPLLNNYLQK